MDRRSAGLLAFVCLSATLLLRETATAAPRLGSAVALRVNGTARYVSPDGEGGLKEGMALSQGHTIVTHADASVDAALTMGAFIRVREDTPLELKRIEQVSKGLLKLDTDFNRFIEMRLMKGGVMVNAGEACECLKLKVETPLGNVTSSGSRFIVTEDGSNWKVMVVSGEAKVEMGDSSESVGKGEMLTLRKAKSGGTEYRKSPIEDSETTGEFNVFWQTLADLESKVLCLPGDACVCFDCFSDWIATQKGGTPPPLEFKGDPMRWADVSPATRR